MTTSPNIHLLHIGKTGGSAVKHAVAEHLDGSFGRLVLHPHKTRLRDIPAGEGVIFFVRDPLTRFVSGFNSRKRQGRPRYDAPWSESEAAAYGRFETADALGRALGSSDPATLQAAIAAMRGIGHVNSSYWDWFEDADYFSERLDDFAFIGAQETLSADFEAFKAKLGLPDDLVLPADDIISHRTPEGLATTLGPAATSNLRDWYARDYEFMLLCEEVRDTVNAPGHGMG